MSNVEDFEKLPPYVERALLQIRQILRESEERQPHVCKDGCRCLAAYRRALAENLGDYTA